MRKPLIFGFSLLLIFASIAAFGPVSNVNVVNTPLPVSIMGGGLSLSGLTNIMLNTETNVSATIVGGSMDFAVTSPLPVVLGTNPGPFEVSVTNDVVLTQTAPLVVTNITTMGKQKVIGFNPAFFQSESVACVTNSALSPVITISGVTNFFLMGYRLFESSEATNTFEILITRYPIDPWPTTNAAIITPTAHWYTNPPAIIASTNGIVHRIGTNVFQVYDRIGSVIKTTNGAFSVQFVNKGTHTNLNNDFWIELIGYEETE